MPYDFEGWATKNDLVCADLYKQQFKKKGGNEHAL